MAPVRLHTLISTDFYDKLQIYNLHMMSLGRALRFGMSFQRLPLQKRIWDQNLVCRTKLLISSNGRIWLCQENNTKLRNTFRLFN